MVSTFGKKESKRMTCHKKYKIRRKVREHNRKLAKTLKKSVNKKKKVDGSIPNMAPFKEEILLEAIKQAEDKKEQKKLKKTTGGLVVTKPKACPVAPVSATKSVSRHLVISNSDILLWVLDARNVAECLDEGVMSDIREAGKRIVFVLNKVDLVPATVVAAWYTKLSKVADVFPVKSTEIMLTDCEQIIPAFKLKFARFGGVKELLEHLKKESTEVKVGVIGKQKVGKSCVVSSVLRACGRTKKKRSTDAKISDKVRIITTPGLIDGTKEGETIGLLHVLSNMSNYMNYPVEVVEALARVITKEQAMVHFTLPEFEHPTGFLNALAVRYNVYFGKSPDHGAAARIVLKQLRDHKLKFHVATGPRSSGEELPEALQSGVKQFLYHDNSLPLMSSELEVKIVKAVKKKRGETDMEGIDEEDSDEEEGEEEEGDSEEEME